MEKGLYDDDDESWRQLIQQAILFLKEIVTAEFSQENWTKPWYKVWGNILRKKNCNQFNSKKKKNTSAKCSK